MSQKAESGDGSPIYQVAGDFIVNGVTETNAKEIALATLRSEFSILYGEAEETFKERVNKIIDDSLNKIKQKDPQLFQRFKEPAIQIALNSVYKEYAKTGDSEIGESLVDLLIDRLSTSERSTDQVIIDDAIVTLPKLNRNHINFIASYYGLHYHSEFGINNLALYNHYINTAINAFPETHIVGEDFILYLKYIGCISDFSMTRHWKNLELVLKGKYKGLFNKGFIPENVSNELMDKLKQNKLLTRCLQNIILLQINTMNDNVLNSQLTNLDAESKQNILKLYNDTTMSEQEIMEYHYKLNPKCKNVFKSVNSDDVHVLQLTKLGLYIGRKYFLKLF